MNYPAHCMKAGSASLRFTSRATTYALTSGMRARSAGSIFQYPIFPPFGSVWDTVPTVTPSPFSIRILASTPEEQIASSMTTPGDLFSSSAFVEKIVKSAMASCFGDPSAFWNLFEFRDPLGSTMMRVAEECSAGLRKLAPPAEAPLSISRLSMSKVIAGCSSRWVMLGQSVVVRLVLRLTRFYSISATGRMGSSWPRGRRSRGWLHRSGRWRRRGWVPRSRDTLVSEAGLECRHQLGITIERILVLQEQRLKPSLRGLLLHIGHQIHLRSLLCALQRLASGLRGLGCTLGLNVAHSAVLSLRVERNDDGIEASGHGADLLEAVGRVVDQLGQSQAITAQAGRLRQLRLHRLSAPAPDHDPR